MPVVEVSGLILDDSIDKIVLEPVVESIEEPIYVPPIGETEYVSRKFIELEIPIPVEESIIEPYTIETRLPSTYFYYIENNREVFVVLEEKYDVTDLSITNLTLLFLARGAYINHSTMRYQMSFDVFLYNFYTQIPAISRFIEVIEEEVDEKLPEEVFEELEIDPEDPLFKFKIWQADIKQKLVALGIGTAVISVIFIVLGVIILGLISFQYVKSYIGAKAEKRAMK